MQSYKPIFFLFLRFFGVYFALTALYNLYLHYFLHDKFPPFQLDLISHKIAEIVGFLFDVLDKKTLIIPDKNRAVDWFYINDKYSENVMAEGCNAISVLAIFTAFIIAFKTQWKQTISYSLLGVISLQIINILRIFGLIYLGRYYSEYSKIAHDYIFPLILYGPVFISWLIWIQYFYFSSSHKTVKIPIQKLILSLFIILGFILIRYIFTQIHDPLEDYFDAYFHQNRKNITFNLDYFYQTFIYSVRYFCNAILGLALIYLWFPQKRTIKISILLYIITFMITLPLIYYSVEKEFILGQTFTFFLRRIIIHPLSILFIFIFSIFINQKNLEFNK